ncbi:hypothetical protein TNCV_2763951 [Trichonephila clavipes]|nr:hypothetical protein TNCV_2763951 [Trichonephila clavipes]
MEGVVRRLLAPLKTLEWFLRRYLSFTHHFLDLVGKRFAINSGPKEPKGHVNEKTREPVTELVPTDGTKEVSFSREYGFNTYNSHAWLTTILVVQEGTQRNIVWS